MKKLLALAFALMTGFGITQAQTCDFTASVNSASGVLSLNGPASLDPSSGMFIWFFSSGAMLNGYTTSYQYTDNAVETITLNVYANTPDSSLICSSTQTISIVLDNPSGGCSIAAVPNGFIPNSYSFSIPGANYAPTWSFGDSSATTSGFQVDYTFPGPGTYNVCANVTGGGFTCNDCISIVIPGDTIVDPVINCDATFYASAGALVGYFIPTGPAFYNDPAAPANSYSWNFGDGSTSTDMYAYHVYDASGTYTVCLTVNAGSLCQSNWCMDVFIPEAITVPSDSACAAYFAVSQDSPYAVNVVNGSSASDASYSWTITGGGISFTATGAYPSIVLESTGSYNLCLTVSTPTCTSTYCDSIIVNDAGLIGGRLAQSGFTINVSSPQTLTGYEVTGIEAVKSSFEVYPNPFQDGFNVKGMDAVAYQIFAVDGKLVQQGAVNSVNAFIDGSSLTRGIYFMNIVNKEGVPTVLKLSKN